MPLLIIVLMCAVAIGVSISRIGAIRARNKAEREQKGAQPPAEALPEQAGAWTFADFLDAENVPTMTFAELDEWRRDFALAVKYGRRPQKTGAPFLLSLRASGFSLPNKSSLPDFAPKTQNGCLKTKQTKLSISGKKAYKAYLQDGTV